MESINLRVARRDPERKTSGWSEYNVVLQEKTTVLDCLDQVQRTSDPTLAFRYACRVGMCGSCAMLVNGKERWTCRTLVRGLKSSKVTVEPLKHLPVVRDLVVEFSPLWQKYREVESAFVPGKGKQNRRAAERNRSLIEPNLQCISCGACYSSCSFVGTDPLYLGPHAMNRVFTAVEDGRDGARDARLTIVDNEHGCWKCHTQQNCTEVCPMDLSPSAGIQHLKRAILKARVLNPERRKFAFAVLGGLVAVVGGYILSERQRVWVAVGPLASIPADNVLPFEYEGEYAYLRRTGDRTVLALSQKCSHQGCRIAFDMPSALFKCPCHQGVFTPEGEVVSGKPIRPLQRFETRLEGDTIQILI